MSLERRLLPEDPARRREPPCYRGARSFRRLQLRLASLGHTLRIFAEDAAAAPPTLTSAVFSTAVRSLPQHVALVGFLDDCLDVLFEQQSLAR